MKTLKLAFIIALCGIIICSCSKKSDTPAHLVAIPKNASFVLAFNAKQIVEKAGLNKPEQYKFYSAIQEELNRMPAEQSKAVKDFIKNTRNSGLNLDNVFLYLVMNDNVLEDETYPVYPLSVGITFLIDDLKTFEKSIKDNDVATWDGDEKVISLGYYVSLQWNDKIAVITFNADENINLFNTDEANSILANELFKADYSDKNDAYLFAEMNTIINLAEDFSNDYYSANQLINNLEQYKDMAMSLTFNDEKGSYVAAAKLLPEEKANELYGKYYKTDFDNNLYKYFPDNSLLAMKFSIKPLVYYNEYKKAIGIGQAEEPTESTTEQVEIIDEKGNVVETEDVVIDKYNGYAQNYNYEIKMLIEQYDEKVTSVLSCFTGDFLGSISGLTNMLQPDFAVAAGIAEGKESDVTALMKEVGFTENADGYYTLSIGYVNFYFAVKENIAYVTMSTNAVAKFLDKGYSPDITSAKSFGKEMKDAFYYVYLNININDYPALLKTYLNMSLGTEQAKVIMPFLEKLQSINAKSVNKNGGEFRIKFNEKEYASKIILKAIDAIAASYLDFEY
ncbi:MAG: DUF4836 family protein [Prevotellaceae bacterium]|jgi:hypothetical protein|nr:DUF4836 family protein [Prevotellaceae bacterium]